MPEDLCHMGFPDSDGSAKDHDIRGSGGVDNGVVLAVLAVRAASKNGRACTPVSGPGHRIGQCILTSTCPWMRPLWPSWSSASRSRPAELLALARQRADAVNPRLNAIVRRLDDVADRQAADSRSARSVCRCALRDQRPRSGVSRLSDVRAVRGRWPMTWPTGTPWSRSGSLTRDW